MNKFGQGITSSSTTTTTSVPTLTQVLAKSSISEGTSGQALVTDGAGTRSFGSVGGAQLVIYADHCYPLVASIAPASSLANSLYYFKEVYVGADHMIGSSEPYTQGFTIPADGCYKITTGARICGNPLWQVRMRVLRSSTVVYQKESHVGHGNCTSTTNFFVWHGFEAGDVVTIHGYSNSTTSFAPAIYAEGNPTIDQNAKLIVEKMNVYV